MREREGGGEEREGGHLDEQKPYVQNCLLQADGQTPFYKLRDDESQHSITHVNKILLHRLADRYCVCYLQQIYLFETADAEPWVIT